jgi:nicotinate-nucleotide adenylyltransferase
MTASRVGILGGTFDPVHEGHLGVAEAARSALALDQVLMIPLHHPPHRPLEPWVSGYHRFAMVALAIHDRQEFVASDVELLANDPSYTSTTLQRLHESGLDAMRMFFITGADAFAEIATWKDYPAILDLAHFVVVARPGYPVAAVPGQLPTLKERMIIAGTGSVTAGAGEDDHTSIWLVDAETPGVSSTEVRALLAAGEPIEGLVPPSVARYIERHGLYRGRKAI